MEIRGVRHALGAAAAVTILADQATKALAVRMLLPGVPVPVIPGFFDLTYVTNPGGVFGILRELEGPVRTILFSAVPLAAIALIIVFSRTIPRDRLASRSALGLILGGALGNLADRVRLGYVIDFLDVYVGPYHWPAFNIADSAICVGVGYLVLEGLFLDRPGEDADPARPPAAP